MQTLVAAVAMRVTELTGGGMNLAWASFPNFLKFITFPVFLFQIHELPIKLIFPSALTEHFSILKFLDGQAL